MKKILIIFGIILALVAAFLIWFFIFKKDLSGKVIIPYISHQKPRIDPHLPSSVPLADKLDEVMFDGLFNVSANPSGITYENGLGEFIDIDKKNYVTIQLKPGKSWQSSYAVSMQEDMITITEKKKVLFTARDLKFTLQRIQKIGSVSPDYVLISQAIPDFSFYGPDENDQVRFHFRGERLWTEADIKEVLSFKIIPANAGMTAREYTNGTGPYMHAGEFENVMYFQKTPTSEAHISNLLLKPFIDNSTYTTELKNKNINGILSTPFGSESPILNDKEKYFHKSSISTCFFAIFFNCNRLDLNQRQALRMMINNKRIMNRFFKIGTMQQRNIANYKGEPNNFEDYLNYSMFPTSTYYVQEQVVNPLKAPGDYDKSVLPDTVRIYTCVNYGHREELSELANIINDPNLFKGRIKAYSVSNKMIKRGNYDAVIVPISGYRSNFLFDLYDIFLREPNFAVKKITLQTSTNSNGEQVVDPRSFSKGSNFFQLDLSEKGHQEYENISKLLDYVYGFMSTSEIGDKQQYAQFIDELEQDMALGSWLFSLPSMAYFSTQFEEKSIDLYGIASQLSTIENWKEKPKK
ncbi:MAG: hypothetical protein HQK83_06670 [Fibrobacteria bacterium]|nr:hypothetical protein [Fibrobacteria bacterium]